MEQTALSIFDYPRIVAGNLVMLGACLLMVACGYIKDGKKMVALHTLNLLLAATGNLILAAYSGAALNLLSIGRNILRARNRFTKPALVVVCLLFAVFGVWTNNRGIFGYLIILGNIAYSVSLFTGNVKWYKVGLAFCISLWAMYDFSIQNYVGFGFDLFTFCSAWVGFFRIRRQEMEAEEGEAYSDSSDS